MSLALAYTFIFFIHACVSACSSSVMMRGSSAPSSLDFGVESFQFYAGVFDSELPIDTTLFSVRLIGPDNNFRLQVEQFANATVTQALARQTTQLTFGHIQPTPMFRSVTEFDSIHPSFIRFRVAGVDLSGPASETSDRNDSIRFPLCHLDESVLCHAQFHRFLRFLSVRDKLLTQFVQPYSPTAASITRIVFHFPLRNRNQKQMDMARMCRVTKTQAQ